MSALVGINTLVLDRAYQPMAKVSWERAVVLWFTGKAEIIEEYADKFIHSVSKTMKVPSVIRFLSKMRRRKRVVKFSRENIYIRDKGRCQFCGEKVSLRSFTYDHVIPRAQGGRTDWFNIVCSCIPCNTKKGGRTPEQSGMKLRMAPTKPKSLPTTYEGMSWKQGMPESWRAFLRDRSYWEGELEQS